MNKTKHFEESWKRLSESGYTPASLSSACRANAELETHRKSIKRLQKDIEELLNETENAIIKDWTPEEIAQAFIPESRENSSGVYNWRLALNAARRGQKSYRDTRHGTTTVPELLKKAIKKNKAMRDAIRFGYC